jgi:hypothetical protein
MIPPVERFNKPNLKREQVKACRLSKAWRQLSGNYFVRRITMTAAVALALLSGPRPTLANIPGGGDGSGANVTVVDNGDGTVTMANGIVSVTLQTSNSHITSVKYTYNNNGSARTTEMLQASNQYYWGGFVTNLGTNVTTQYGALSFNYTLAIDPASNGGDRADLKLVNSTPGTGGFEAHFTLQRGAQGFYTTAILSHSASDPAMSVNAYGLISRVPPQFNWLSIDDARNFFVGAQSTSLAHPSDIPKETNLALNGTQAGEFENKFIEAQDHADQKAWGWSSVGSTGTNIGVWMMTNLEFSDGGPLKRDVTAYPGNNINNSILTQEVGQGTDSTVEAGEVWTKVCGPWLYYVNSVSASITDEEQAAQDLYNDAVAQDAAEKAAWPYSWFPSSAYVAASGRGVVTGKIAISDSGNRNPVISGTWVGLEQQPVLNPNSPFYDFQKWLKPYQYWTQTDSGGNFTIPDVIAGSNYTLFCYGPGAAGTFMSQNLNGGSPPYEVTLPATPFAVTVAGGKTTNLGTVTWSPKRVGATVFELGYPDRKADKYRHGEDFWAPEHSPALGFPTPVWGGQAYYLQEFPNGINYTVGQSKWSRDWNYVLPSQLDSTGAYQPTTATITFNLASAPASGASASLYLGVAGDYGGKVILSVNGANLGAASGVTAAPQPLTAAGYSPPSTGNYTDNSSIHMSDHGPFVDERVNFPASLLHAGQNTLTINMNAVGYSNYIMVDYLRLELTGYVPPAPTSVTVYPGNNRNLVTWPVMPGAARYNILRSTTSGSGYVSLASGQLGTVCGTDASINTYTDTTAVNNTTYYYVVQSWNVQNGYSPNSPQASGRPLSTLATSAPATPTITVSGSGSHSVNLSWSASAGANFYVLTRKTLADNNVGGAYVLRTITLDDHVTGTTHTNTAVSDGKLYDYSVKAVNAAGVSADSAPVMAEPLPAAPAAPAGLTATALSSTSVKLTWNAAANAIGYVIYRSTTSGGPYVFPANYVNSGVRTSLTDNDVVAGTTYYYRVTSVNAGAISPHSYVTVTTP